MDHDPTQQEPLAEGPTTSSRFEQPQRRPVRHKRFQGAPYELEESCPPESLVTEAHEYDWAVESAGASGAGPTVYSTTGSKGREYPEIANRYEGSGRKPTSNGPTTREYSEIANSYEGEDFSMPLSGSGAHSPAAKPLRLIHVGPCFMNGGVEQHTLSLAKFLDPERIDFVKCLVTNPRHLSPRAVAAMPVPVEYCAPSDLHRVADECDIMLLWGDGFDEFLKPARPSLCIFVAHGESWWTAQTLRNSLRVVDHAIAVSNRVKDRACGNVPSTTILNGVDASHLGQTGSREAMRERLGFAPQDFVIGSVGRFSQEKRMPLLIEAVSRLPRQFKLMLVGHGARRHELLDRANALIPGRYVLATADEYLGDYYRAMDAFSLVSEHEGFGLVIAEALLCERPVIATNVGCVPEIIRDRVNGLVVDATPDSIAAAARMLYEHPHWAKGLAAEGRAVADAKLHAARMAREYEDLLWRLWRTRTVFQNR